MLTWESNQILGVNSILEKLESLPFQKVVHKTDTIDAQPSSASVASLMVLVTGQLIVDDNQNPIPFSQVFQLMPEGGSYYVQNDVFRWVTMRSAGHHTNNYQSRLRINLINYICKQYIRPDFNLILSL